MSAKERSDTLQAALQRFCLVVEQVICCVVVSDDGLPLAAYPADSSESAGDNGVDSVELAALAATLAGMGERTLTRLSQGKPGRLVLEGEAGALLTCPIGDVALAILVESEANLAQVLFAAQKASAEIEEALSLA